MLINTNSVNLCQNSVFAKLSGCQKWGFRKENCIFCVIFSMLEQRNRKIGKKGQKPYKNWVFKGGHPKMRKTKKNILQKLPDTICVRNGEKTRIFVHTIFVTRRGATERIWPFTTDLFSFVQVLSFLALLLFCCWIVVGVVLVLFLFFLFVCFLGCFGFLWRV